MNKIALISGDLTELQTSMARFAAASKVFLRHPLDPRWILQLLTDVESAWGNFSLTREEEMWLAEKFTAMQGNEHVVRNLNLTNITE